MEWDIIYIKDQNCQKRALIIENLTESKEQLFSLLSEFVVGTGWKPLGTSKHNYLIYKNTEDCLE